MRTVYTILSTFLLIAMLFIGFKSIADEDATFSESENRNLKTFPNITAASFAKGEWFEDYLAYYRDTFPSREALLEENRTLSSFYNFTALADEDDVQIVIDFQSNAAHGGEALAQTEPQESTVQSQPMETTQSTEAEQTTEPSEATETIPDPTEPAAPAEDLGQAILVGNRAMDVPYVDHNALTTYANSVNAIADALGSDVRTFCIDVPNAAAFYAPEEYRTGDCDQKTMIDFCYDRLADNVITVDAYTPLAQHTDEYLYFRTDHHWTQLGAYYAYTAFCEKAGLEVQPLDKFETGSYENFVGSMHTYLSGYSQASILAEEPDTLHYYRPFVELNTTYYTDSSLEEGYGIGTICYIEDDVPNKYLTYLGGDHPITVIETDTDGPVCILLKESYGNAFAPWLTSHYSKIIVIDPREFNRDDKPSMDLRQFAKEQNVEDCIILNYPMLLNSIYYADWLGRMVQ
ncbi:MAG: hypothetical protein E7434_03765 [Ruminococcaceae bacterium]|nr:hypothetical protein [Oscillospiraceae bacterium]